jgi:hypothetical protein
MKHIFFFAILVLLPIVVIASGLIYLVWHTGYTFYDDWHLKRELEEIRAASRAKRAQAASTPPPSDVADDQFPESVETDLD